MVWKVVEKVGWAVPVSICNVLIVDWIFVIDWSVVCVCCEVMTCWLFVKAVVGILFVSWGGVEDSVAVVSSVGLVVSSTTTVSGCAVDCGEKRGLSCEIVVPLISMVEPSVVAIVLSPEVTDSSVIAVVLDVVTSGCVAALSMVDVSIANDLDVVMAEAD